MKENNKSACLRCAFISLLCLIASQAYAQKKDLLKILAMPLETAPHGAKMLGSSALSRTHYKPVLQLNEKFINASGVRINPNGIRHSTVPSACTILGSDKVPSSGIKTPPPAVNSSYISADERVHWKQLREMFTSLSYYKPVPPAELSRFLRHSVPGSTFQHIQTQYADMIAQSQEARAEILPIIVYASLPGEGRRPQPEQVGKISEQIYMLLSKIRELRTALPDEPFLAKQQEAWEHAFGAFNPLVAGLIISPVNITGRTDARVLNTREFNLYNPDGTDYLLPRSETLLVDPDELEEMESYAAVREKMRNPPIKPEDAAAERAELLDKLPSGMRIALINDDALPRFNFQEWGKKGYLGHNATVEVFPDGNGFMANVRNGARYDLVITDLLVPYGGIAMMPALRKMDSKAVVIAASKFDRGEEDEQKLFNLGFDGYLWYNTNLNEGAYGYIEYLRAMKNYFFYKQKYNWQR